MELTTLPEILTSKQVAAVLLVHDRTAREHWEKMGGFRIGSKYRMHRSKLLKYMGVEDAILPRERSEMAGTSPACREEAPFSPVRYEGTGQGMGSRDQTQAVCQAKSRHGLW